MKKMMILACLIFSVTAITAVAADVAKMQSTENGDMVTELAAMDANGWCDYLNSAIESGDDALIKKVIMNAQTALNQLDDAAAKDVASAINEKVSDVSVARYLTGKYALAYIGSVNSNGKIVTNSTLIAGDNVGEEDLDGNGVNFKSGNIGKGIFFLSEEEKDHPQPHPWPVSGRSSVY